MSEPEDRDNKAYPDAPRVAVGAVVLKDGRVLLVKRRDPPNAGQWAIPGGTVRLGESLREAAERELYEETGIRARAGAPVYIFDVVDRDLTGRTRYHYVIADLLVEYVSGNPAPRDDAVGARWLSPQELDSIPINATTRDLLRNTLNFGR
jgi:8-oxo-dGTP diphosphatase